MGHILVIEDEPAINMILREILTDKGHEVINVNDGFSGLKRLKEHPKPDLVMVDLNMPGLSGRDVIESMHSDTSLKDIPVVLVTGAVYSPEEFPSQDSYQAIIEKPFELMDMLNKVEELMKLKFA